MGLKAMPPVLAALPGKVGWLPPLTEAQIDRGRAERNEGRRWYNTAAWRRLRWDVLREALFTCAMCGAAHGLDAQNLVADHITPHKGDPGLFWDRANLQCLCAPCHSRVKQAEEIRAVR